MRILNTRPAEAAKSWTDALIQGGHEVAEWPLVEIAPLFQAHLNPPALEIEFWGGLFFSSPHGLKYGLPLLNPQQINTWMQLPIYSISSRLQEKLQSLGGQLTFAPRRPSLDDFLKEFPSPPSLESTKPWLHLCSSETRVDPATFAKHGIAIQNFPVYEPRLPRDAARQYSQLPWMPDALLFASGSAVRNFATAQIPQTQSWPQSGMFALSCGPSTTEALTAIGWKTILEAPAAEPQAVLKVLARP
jgi:uroporphyrinogen-III synthase